MRNVSTVIQIAFTYIGTIVGAGFATGQELLYFFTRFGFIAVVTIAIATILFILLGTKILLLSYRIKAYSYEDLNRQLFGDTFGRSFSYVMLVILFCVTSVMLAGGGTIFSEHFHLPYQFGLLFTLTISYFVILKGVKGIFTINSIVVPMMLIFTVILLYFTWNSPNSHFWITRTSDLSVNRALIAPFLYVGFNLILTQAVLVPIGSSIRHQKTVIWGGIVGGTGIGFMLLAGHICLSSEMPGVMQYEVPMGTVVAQLGHFIQVLFLLLIYAEIFTTLIANIYGLTRQLESKLPLSPALITILLLVGSYLISQIGFRTLVSSLYPLFGILSLFWLWQLIRHPSRFEQA